MKDYMLAILLYQNIGHLSIHHMIVRHTPSIIFSINFSVSADDEADNLLISNDINFVVPDIE